MENELNTSEQNTEDLQEMFKAYGTSNTNPNKNPNQGRFYFTKESMKN